jgi:HAD superfamily hydrolase (TIGR01549 family)
MYRAILFDLYDTVVLFRRPVPTLTVAGTRWRSTMGWMTEAVGRELPWVEFDAFVRAMTETTAEIIRQRPPEYLEVPSSERFRRVLVRLGVTQGLEEKAARLSATHMQHLAEATELPTEHLTLLRSLADRYRLGLVSNFDHGPTARAMIARHGLTELFASILISDGFGRRKPHPAIFAEALSQLGVNAADAVFVGDSLADDVGGAHAAGIDAVWLNADGIPLPQGSPAPRYTIRRLVELPEVLGPA